MEKRKMKKLVAICSIVMLLLCAVPSVFASSTSYAGTFPALQAHTTLAQGRKDSSQSTSAYNTITGPAQNTYGYFWIDLQANGSRVANEKRCGKGITAIPYVNSDFTGAVVMRAKAGTFSLQSYEVRGTVNFS